MFSALGCVLKANVTFLKRVMRQVCVALVTHLRAIVETTPLPDVQRDVWRTLSKQQWRIEDIDRGG